MKYYELTYLISPEFNEEELKVFSQKIGNFIQEVGGKIEEANKPTKIRFGYPIKKTGGAYLITLNFYFDPEKFGGLEKKLKSESQILRYTILGKKIAKVIEVPKKPLGITKKIEKPKEKKVELKEIEKKLEEILGE